MNEDQEMAKTEPNLPVNEQQSAGQGQQSAGQEQIMHEL
jgi:hypothetical protein